MDQTNTNTQITPWPTISGSDDFKSSTPEVQEAIRQQYFDKAIAPTLNPEETDSVKQSYLQKSLMHDHNAGYISTPDTLSRFKSYGITPNQEEINPYSTNSADTKNKFKAVGEGLLKGSADLAGGVLKTLSGPATSSDRSVPIATTTDNSQLYEDINAGRDIREANVTQAEKEHPAMAFIGKAIPEAAALVAGGPELEAASGAGVLKNAVKAGLEGAPSAGATVAATSNANTAEEKSKEGLYTAVLNPAVMAGGTALAKALEAGISASANFVKAGVSRFTEAGRDANAVAMLRNQYSNNPAEGKAALSKDVDAALTKFKDTGVQVPTTVLPAGKVLAQETSKGGAAQIQQAEENAATQMTGSLTNKFPEGNTQQLKASVAGDVNTSEVNTQKQQELANNIKSNMGNIEQEKQRLASAVTNNPSTGAISETENAHMLDTEKTLAAKRNEAYNTSLEASSKIQVPKEELNNALTGLSDISVLNKYQTRSSNIGVTFDKKGNLVTDSNGDLIFNKTPSLTDINELNSRINDDLENVYKGRSSKLTTDQEIEDAKNLQASLSDIKEKLIGQQAEINPEMEKTLRPEKYANENYYSYGKGTNPTASGKGSDFYYNAIQDWRNARNSDSASNASTTLERFFDKGNPNEQADAVKSLVNFHPDSATALGDYFSQRALEKAIESGEFKPDAATKYITSRNNALTALPEDIRTKVLSNVRAYTDLANSYNAATDTLKGQYKEATGKTFSSSVKDFFNWATGKESNAVFDNALKSEGALNDLYGKFTAINAKPENKQALDTLLQNRFLTSNTESKNIPVPLGKNKGSNIHINSVAPKVVQDIITESKNADSMYPVAKKLYGDKFDTLKQGLENLNLITGDIPNIRPTDDAMRDKLAGELPKIAGYASGLRYGTISSTKALLDYFKNGATEAAKVRVLSDINYAKAINDAFKTGNTDRIGQLIGGNLTSLSNSSKIVSGVSNENTQTAKIDTDVKANISHLAEADKALKLTPQEKYLYNYHLYNLNNNLGVKHENGSLSTIYQTSVEHDGKVYNIPTVVNGNIVHTPEAIKAAAKVGWNKWPSYSSDEEAESRYENMHTFMEKDTTDFMRSSNSKSGSTK